MKKILFCKRLQENVNAGMIILACVIMIAFLISACAGSKKMQSSASMDETVKASAESGDNIKMASAEDESGKSEISDDQTIECRKIEFTGSRFKKKVCKTKAQWAWESGVSNKNAEDLQKNTDRSFSKNVPVANDSGGFPGAGVPR
jgi:hypothetical protein